MALQPGTFARAASGLLVLLVAWAALAVAPALAQTEANESDVPVGGGTADGGDGHARKLFVAGRAAYEVGRYAEALEYFQASFDLSDRPRLLYNIGQAADRLRRDETALSAYRRYIERLPDAENRVAVEQRIAVLETVVRDRRAAEAAQRASVEEARARAEHDARATQASELDRSLQQGPQAESESLLSQWWLWAAAGGVATVAVVGIVLATQSPDARVGAPTVGSDGKVVTTLQWTGP